MDGLVDGLRQKSFTAGVQLYLPKSAIATSKAGDWRSVARGARSDLWNNRFARLSSGRDGLGLLDYAFSGRPEAPAKSWLDIPFCPLPLTENIRLNPTKSHRLNLPDVSSEGGCEIHRGSIDRIVTTPATSALWNLKMASTLCAYSGEGARGDLNPHASRHQASVVTERIQPIPTFTHLHQAQTILTGGRECDALHFHCAVAEFVF